MRRFQRLYWNRCILAQPSKQNSPAYYYRIESSEPFCVEEVYHFRYLTGSTDALHCYGKYDYIRQYGSRGYYFYHIADRCARPGGYKPYRPGRRRYRLFVSGIKQPFLRQLRLQSLEGCRDFTFSLVFYISHIERIIASSLIHPYISAKCHEIAFV